MAATVSSRERVPRAASVTHFSLDWLLLSAVPLVMLAAFALPTSVKQGYVFAYADPTLSTAFLSHFIHFDRTHLVSNLIGWTLLSTTVYALFMRAGNRRQFRITVLVVVSVFPVVLSFLNLAVPRNGVSYGASGIVMALVGVFPVALVLYARTRVDEAVSLDRSGGLFFLALALVSVLAIPLTSLTLGVSVACAVIAVGYLVPRELSPDKRVTRGFDGLFGVSLVLFFGFVFIAFPATATTDGTVTNLYVHHLGLSLGYIATYSTFRTGLISSK